MSTLIRKYPTGEIRIRRVENGWILTIDDLVQERVLALPESHITELLRQIEAELRAQMDRAADPVP